MTSSGTTALATVSDAAITILSAATGLGQNLSSKLTVFTDGTPCFVSADGGANWLYIPSGFYARTFTLPLARTDITLKRVAGGTNVTGIYADVQ